MISNIRDANTKDISAYLKFEVFSAQKLKCKIRYLCYNQLCDNFRKCIIQILEKNMKNFYDNSSWGWSLKNKEDELFNINSKYLLIFDISSDENQDNLIGFCHFRFDEDYGYDVLYCYELQIAQEFQGKGIGKIIMNIIEDIGVKTKMEKIVLTVLNNNPPSITFFKGRCGYILDATSPTPHSEYCYTILSKTL